MGIRGDFNRTHLIKRQYEPHRYKKDLLAFTKYIMKKEKGGWEVVRPIKAVRYEEPMYNRKGQFKGYNITDYLTCVVKYVGDEADVRKGTHN